MTIDGINMRQAPSAPEKVSVEPVTQQQVGTRKVEEFKEKVSQGAEEHVAVINDEMLDKAIESANKTLSKHDKFIERTVHEVTKTVMYVMKDSETDEVVREFPPKKIQDMIAKMWEIAGLFVDEKI